MRVLRAKERVRSDGVTEEINFLNGVAGAPPQMGPQIPLNQVF